MPRYVHGIAIGVAVGAAIVLRRGGALHSAVLVNVVIVLVPPAAIYYFYAQSRRLRTPNDASRPGETREHRDRDV